MFVALRHKYEYMQEEIERRENLSAAELQNRRNYPLGGTIKIIKGDMDFKKTDGYIQFLKRVLHTLQDMLRHRTSQTVHQDALKEWIGYTDKIICLAEKLTDGRVRFTGTTKDEFKVYCNRISGILNQEAIPLKELHFTTVQSDFLPVLLKNHMEEGCKFGFYYEPGEYTNEIFTKELMAQLSNLKIEKSRHDHMDMSYFLMDSGYHEHIHDAVNILIQTAVYVMNCQSTRDVQAYGFDINKILNDLRLVEDIIKRIEYLI